MLALLVVEAEDLVNLVARDGLVDDHWDAVLRVGLLEERAHGTGLAHDVDSLVADLAEIATLEAVETKQRLDVTGPERKREVVLPCQSCREGLSLICTPQ